MKNTPLRLIFSAVLSLASLALGAQLKQQQPFFDIKKAQQDAINRGMPANEIPGYLQALESMYYDQFVKSTNPNDPNNTYTAQRGSNPTIQSAGCPNASFEYNSFANWTGSSGTAATGPVYNIATPSIVSPGGANAGLLNTANYHTIVNIPPTNPTYPNCNQFGYDSIAVKIVGTNTVSEVPHVCPFFTDGTSTRMNSAQANYRACKMKYNMTLSSTNRSITYAFALVIYDGGHSVADQPYFTIQVSDQFNNPIGGTCGIYNVNATQVSSDTSFKASGIAPGWGIYYRPWRLYTVDLSSPAYSTVTAVNLEFTVSGCAQGGHWAYAYVDAECSAGGANSSMCVGTNTAVLNAPSGYLTYQWYQQPGNIAMSPSVGGNTPTLTINPAVTGQVYQVKMVTPTGCTITLNDTIKVSGIQITSVGSTPSCPGGNSGTAVVNVTGSNTGYGFQWINSIGNTVSTTYTAGNLAPGVYTVVVSGVSCGPPATSTVMVGTAAPMLYTKTTPYCGNLAVLTNTTGTGYAWYNNLTPIPTAAGQPSLLVTAPVNNAVYYSTYISTAGCKDSVKFILQQIPGGSINISNVKPICVTSGSVSYGVVNLSTTQTGPFTYSVTGPGGYSSALLNTPARKDSVTGLSIGTYTVNVFDGACYYTSTFTVSPYTFNYTVTPTNTLLCVSGTVPMAANFGTTVPTACGLSTSGGCTSSNVIQVGAGTNVNSTTTYPSIYGNWYKNCRHQLLFTAADLTAAGVLPGKLSSIDFMVNSIPSGYIGTIPGLLIKIKCTSATVLTSNFDNTGLITVVGPANYSPITGWNTHAFSTAYEWDGVSNILVDICYTLNTGSNYSNNVIMPSTNTGVVKCVYQYSDVTPLCGGATGITSLNRPNVRFGNCGSTNPSNFTYSWTPSYALSSTNTQSTVATPSASTIYTITVNPIGQTNCAQSQTVNINVVTPVTPTITGGTFCNNFAPVTIPVTPTTGTWSATPYLTSGGVFTPSLAAIGSNTVGYTVGAGTCIAMNTLTINVEQYNPSTITGSISPKCVGDLFVNMMTLVANTTGTWSGAGINPSNIFDPAMAGPGIYTFTYSTHSMPTASLCPDMSTLQVSVSGLTQPTITAVGPYCNTGAPVQLQVTPTGGYYAGLNNTATSPTGAFDPSTAIIGGNAVGYTITSGPCTKTTSTIINVEQFVSASLTSGLGPYCYNAPQTALAPLEVNHGGTWTGQGINGNTMFNPMMAGAGTHTVMYSTHSSPTASLCPDATTLSVHVNPQPVANIVSSSEWTCNPGGIQFTCPTVNTGNGIWYFGDGTPYTPGLSANHTYTAVGTYSVTFDYTDDIGCKAFGILPYFITVFPSPVADFNVTPDDQVSISDPEVGLVNTSTVLNDNSYLWVVDNYYQAHTTDASYVFTEPGSYYVTLTATNSYGCTANITKLITVTNEFGFWIPNAFTPNDDHVNDVFRPVASPYGLDLSIYEMLIYDRWGTMVFSTQDYPTGWNGAMFNKGEILKSDVYVYKIRYKDAEGTEYEKTGHVSLIK